MKATIEKILAAMGLPRRAARTPSGPCRCGPTGFSDPQKPYSKCLWPGDVLIVGHTHVKFELVVNAPPGKILNPGTCCGKAYVYRKAGPLIVPDEFRPATFGVLELPSMRFEVYRALDGERVLGTSPDRPYMRALRWKGGRCEAAWR